MTALSSLGPTPKTPPARRPAPEAVPAAVPAADGVVVEIVLPVFNEAHVLGPRLDELCAYLDGAVTFPWRVTIADNASTDGTWALARRLADERDGVGAVHLEAKGRGRALKAAWSASDAPVLVYMDVDLSTGLDALLPLVAPIISGHSDLVVGSRRLPGARVRRSVKREVISRAYNLLVLLTLRVRVHDAQCGFKAISRSAAAELLPLVTDDAWFFDTELLAAAEQAGRRVVELPVDWVEDPDSRVHLWSTALADLVGIARVVRARRARRRPVVTASPLTASLPTPTRTGPPAPPPSPITRTAPR